MPISSYHRLPSASTGNPWNTTRSPRQSGLRQRSKTFHAGDTTDDSCEFRPDGLIADKLGEGRATGKVRPKSATGLSERRRTQSVVVRHQARAARNTPHGRPPLKRRETLPALWKQRDGNGAGRVAGRNNRSDFSMRCKVSRWKQINSQQANKKKSAWSGKRNERNSDAAMKPKGRTNKAPTSPLYLSPSPTDGSPGYWNFQNPDIGRRVVCVLNKRTRLGVLKYCGRTHFAEGHWCGIVLDKPCGKNDGSVRGVRYFQCENKHGIFVHSCKVGTVDDYWKWFSSQIRDCENNTATTAKVLTENRNWNNIQMSCVEKKCRSSGFSKYNSNGHKAFHKIENRTRSRSLERCCVVKVKLSTKSGSKCTPNSAQLVRSVSLPKIRRSSSLVSVKGSSELKEGPGDHQNGEHSSRRKPLSGSKDLTSTLPNVSSGVLSSGMREIVLDQSSDSMDFVSSKFDHTAVGHKKLGHTVSLDRHLKMENGHGIMNSSHDDWHPGFANENNLVISKNADAFLEGQYTSCPNLVPSVGGKMSDGLATCLDLGQTNRETPAHESGLDVKHKGDGTKDENTEITLTRHGKSVSQSKLVRPSSPSGETLDENSQKRLSLPCLLPQSVPSEVQNKERGSLWQGHDSVEGDVDPPLEDHETASSSCSHISESEMSLSSSGICALNNSAKVVKGSTGKPSSVKHPSKLKRPGDFKDRGSLKTTGQMPCSKQNSGPLPGEVVSGPGIRPSKLALDKRFLKRNTVSDMRLGVVDQPSKRDIAEHVAGSTPTQEMKGGKSSKLPMLKQSSSSNLQPASKEPALVSRRASGIQVPAVKTTSRKSSATSGNAHQSDREKVGGTASVAKPSLRNAQTSRDSVNGAAQQGTKTTTRRASASSSKAAKPTSGSGARRTSTTSAAEDRKPSCSSRPGIKQSSKPIPATQSTSKPTSKLQKFPSRKTPDRLSTPEPRSDRTAPRHINHAPDILSQTPEVIKHSVEVQVNDEEGQKALEELKGKSLHLQELLSDEKKQCQDLEGYLKELTSDCLAAAIVVNFFGGELHSCGRNILLLQSKAAALLGELEETKKTLGDEQANGVRLQEEMTYIENEHQIAVEALKADQEKMLGELRQNLTAKFTEEMDEAVRSHISQLDEKKAEHAKEVESLMKKHEESMAALLEHHKDEITELENKQSHAVEEIMEEHQVEVETIKTDYEEQETKLKNKIEDLSSECSSLSQTLKKTQEDAQRDIESRIQDAIKAYESLPAELESMNAVLEMKNEEIKSLRQEKMEITMEFEQLRKIQDRIQKLEQENESLNFVVENKVAFQRQLSVERDTLRNSLEREAKKANRLSLENEELQWRLFNSPSPPLSADSTQGPSSWPKRLSCSFPDMTTLDE